MKKTTNRPAKTRKRLNMESHQLWHLSFMSIWIFVVLVPSVCSGQDAPRIHLESRVFVAFTGKDLNIDCKLNIPANQSHDILKCYDPSPNQIYKCDVSAMAGQPQNFTVRLELKNVTSSGEYFCEYKTAMVYWFLRVRDYGYEEVPVLDYTFITLAVFTVVLLVFSVVGSVYVFRGYWKEGIADCCNTGRKQRQSREERNEREMEKDNVDAITAPSTSFYASLEPRPRSIYDVLDRSAANTRPDHSKAKPKKKEPQNTMMQTTQPQQEGVFESVYENF